MDLWELVKNYSPKWRWIEMDIYWAVKQGGRCLPLSPTLRGIMVLVFNYTEIENYFIYVSFVSSAARKWIKLANHLQTSQSARANSNVHVCGIYYSLIRLVKCNLRSAKYCGWDCLVFTFDESITNRCSKNISTFLADHEQYGVEL